MLRSSIPKKRAWADMADLRRRFGGLDAPTRRILSTKQSNLRPATHMEKCLAFKM